MNIWTALVGGVGVVLAAFLSYKGAQFAIKQARQANKDDRDAVWNAAYRNAVEPHLYYDIARAGDIQQLRNVVNNLEIALGKVPTVFPEIPEPPPLFPKLEGGKPVIPPSK